MLTLVFLINFYYCFSSTLVLVGVFHKKYFAGGRVVVLTKLFTQAFVQTLLYRRDMISVGSKAWESRPWKALNNYWNKTQNSVLAFGELRLCLTLEISLQWQKPREKSYLAQMRIFLFYFPAVGPKGIKVGIAGSGCSSWQRESILCNQESDTHNHCNVCLEILGSS